MYITMRALKKSLYRLSGIICTVCQQNSPKPWMYRLFVVILSEFIWPLNFIAHEFHEFSCKRVQSRIYSGYAERSRKCQEIFTNLYQWIKWRPVRSHEFSLIQYFRLRSAIWASSISWHFSLRFSATLGNMSKLYCTRLHENCTRLALSLQTKGKWP